MGWKISGIAIDGNKTQLQKVITTLGFDKFEVSKKENFEEATCDFLELPEISVGEFNDKLLILNAELIQLQYQTLSTSFDVLAFHAYDTMGDYCFDLYKNGKVFRSKWVMANSPEMNSSDGAVLPEEEMDEDDAETIFNVLGTFIEKRFYDIDPEHAFERIMMSKTKSKINWYWTKRFN